MDGSQIIKTLSDGIDMLAKKLEVAVDKIYPILMKQAKYQMFSDILWVLVGIGLIILAIKLTKMFVKSIKTKGCMFYENWNDTYNDGFVTVLAVIVLAVLFIGSGYLIISNIQEIMQIIINPEWYIFEYMIKPLLNK